MRSVVCLFTNLSTAAAAAAASVRVVSADDDSDYSDHSEDEMEDDAAFAPVLPPPHVPAAAAVPLPAAAAAAAPPLSFPPFPATPRPTIQVPSMTQPVWTVSGDEQCTKSLASFVQSMIRIAERTNMTKGALLAMFDTFKEHMPKHNAIPTFREAEHNLLAACAVQARHYIVCVNDCSLVRPPMDELTRKDAPEATKAQLDAIQSQTLLCPVCREPYADSKRSIRKVRVATACLLQRFVYDSLLTHASLRSLCVCVCVLQ